MATTKPSPAIVLLALAAQAVPALHAGDVTVFAAASLTDALTEIAGSYEQQSGDQIVFSFGSSSTLARQIEAGAPADLFFSADAAKMDGLEKNNRIRKDTRKSLLENQLVIVVAAEAGAPVQTPQDLAQAGVTRIALGDPKAAPIGVYAKEYLAGLGLWADIEPKVVATENVRAAMAAVEAGNAAASIVYKTDAAVSQKVKVVFQVPLAEGPKITYPVALVQDTPHAAAATRFLEHLCTDTAGRVFRQFGFIVTPPPQAP